MTSLLSEMVPHDVIKAVNAGSKVEPRMYDALGVVMMEIVGWNNFTHMAAIDRALHFLDNLTTQINQVGLSILIYT